MQFRARYLLLGALFTGMAIMTKGIFALFAIFSGLACLWLYQRQWSRLFSIKWLAALGLVVIVLSIYVMNPALLATMAAICAGLSYYLYATRTAPLQFRVIFKCPGCRES